MSLIVALDLGGTKLDAALVRDGQLVEASRNRVPTGPGMNPERLRAALRQTIVTALEAGDAEQVAGIGMGTPGPFAADGEAIEPVNMLGLHGFALRAEVAAIAEELLGRAVPVEIGHDGGCFALAEALYGAAAGTRASMSVVVSTGVGGGIVVDGRLLRGARGNAGHIGQTHDASGDTVEDVASGPHSVRWARTEGWDGETGEDLARDARDGHPVARAAIERSARAVGAAFCDATTLIDLDVIVLGGGFSNVSDDYADLVQAELRERAVLGYAGATRVVRSALAGTGPLLGAAALVHGV